MNAELVFRPSGTAVKVRRGTTVLDAARRAGVAIPTRCGGKAACFMCKVKVLPGSELSPPGEAERHKLGELLEQSIRLSCQARVFGKAEIEVPLDPLKAAVARQLALQKQQEDELW